MKYQFNSGDRVQVRNSEEHVWVNRIFVHEASELDDPYLVRREGSNEVVQYSQCRPHPHAQRITELKAQMDQIFLELYKLENV